MEEHENIIAAGHGREREEQKTETRGTEMVVEENRKHRKLKRKNRNCTIDVNHMLAEGARQLSSIETKGRRKAHSKEGLSAYLIYHYSFKYQFGYN